MTPFIVPTLDEFTACTDDELATWVVRLTDAIAGCEASAAGARALGNEDGAARVNGARRHYIRGIRTVRAEQSRRAGAPHFMPAKPVVDFRTAIDNSKATNRLLGLLNDLFLACGAVDVSGPEVAVDEMQRAYDACAEAMNVGREVAA